MEEATHYLKTELYTLVQRDPSIFDFIQSGALDGVWYWDLEQREHEWMSPRMWQALGYDPADMPHSPSAWQALIFPEDVAPTISALEQHLADPAVPFDQTLRYRGGQGQTVWIRCRGMAIRDEQGRCTRMLGAHTDITALKEAEQRLQEANLHLNDRRRELESFISLASHDLKAPLRQLGSLAMLLRDDLAERGMTDPDVQEVIDLLVRRADLALQMHNDLLDYATAGTIAVTPEEVDLGALLQEVWASHDRPGFSLRVPSPLPRAILPRTPVMTALTNLISNAIRHHDRAAGTITVTASADGPVLSLSVADDGPGIPPSQRALALAAFQTLKSRDTGGGTGLGLALVQRLTERFGEGVALHGSEPRGLRVETRWSLTDR